MKKRSTPFVQQGLDRVQDLAGAGYVRLQEFEAVFLGRIPGLESAGLGTGFPGIPDQADLFGLGEDIPHSADGGFHGLERGQARDVRDMVGVAVAIPMR